MFRKIKFILLMLLFLNTMLFAEKNVLVLHSYHHGLQWTDNISNGIMKSFENSKETINIYFEYLDSKRHLEKSFIETTFHYFTLKHSSNHFDAIIVSDNKALSFINKYQDKLFSNTPVIFTAVNNFTPELASNLPHVTGVKEMVDYDGTLTVAMNLFPKRKKVMIVLDNTLTAKNILSEVKVVEKRFKDKLEFYYFWDFEEAKLAQFIKENEDNLIAYALAFNRDKKGNFFNYDKAIGIVKNIFGEKIPIFGSWDFFLGKGIVGGVITTGYNQGKIAGDLALRVLQNSEANDISIESNIGKDGLILDYTLMQKFSLEEPQTSLSISYINKPNDFFQQYKIVLLPMIFIMIILIMIFILREFKIRKKNKMIEESYKDMLKRKNFILNKAQSQAKLGSWEKKSDDETLICSDESYRIFEVDPSRDVTTKQFISIVHPNDRSLMLPIFQKSINEHTEYTLKHRLEFSDGRIKYVIEHAEHFYDNNNKYLHTIGTVQDITEQQENLKLLKHKKQELETIIQDAPNPIFLHQEDGKILMLNKAWVDSTGFSLEDVPTINDLVDLIYDDEESIISLKEHIPALYKLTKKTKGSELTFLNKNRDLLTWKFSSAPLGLINGKRTIISSAMDITELKQKDEILIKQSRHAIMGEMISMIAHQWRQPLSTISMDANNMLLDIALDDFSMSASEKYANNISEQTEHLSQTIDDFRNFFKPDKEISKVNIKDIYEKTLSIVQDSLRSHSIELKTTFETQTQVNAFERELMQVFVNIITNAKDALVSNKIENPTINVRVYEDDKYVNTEICDNGGGIDANILDKVFDPYFSTKGDLNGTGLGLYMSKVIIENHLNGTLDVKNNDKGACFIVRLLKEK
ncbi:MAG: PAS domain S-box-containing protein [Sulfurimonas sp.]|jgi:PAS domain S-box-containing protein